MIGRCGSSKPSRSRTIGGPCILRTDWRARIAEQWSCLDGLFEWEESVLHLRG